MSNITGEIKFIVDINAGKLARWLRFMGYDTLLFTELDDGQMVRRALSDNRIILTKDTQVLKRRVVSSGKVKAVLVQGEKPGEQLQQIVKIMDLTYQFNSFTRCLECNCPLVEKSKEQIRDLVPPHVYQTQALFMTCSTCHRVYWQGTHWKAMCSELGNLLANKTIKSGVKES